MIKQLNRESSLLRTNSEASADLTPSDSGYSTVLEIEHTLPELMPLPRCNPGVQQPSDVMPQAHHATFLYERVQALIRQAENALTQANQEALAQSAQAADTDVKTVLSLEQAVDIVSRIKDPTDASLQVIVVPRNSRPVTSIFVSPDFKLDFELDVIRRALLRTTVAIRLLPPPRRSAKELADDAARSIRSKIISSMSNTDDSDASPVRNRNSSEPSITPIGHEAADAGEESKTQKAFNVHSQGRYSSSPQVSRGKSGWKCDPQSTPKATRKRLGEKLLRRHGQSDNQSASCSEGLASSWFDDFALPLEFIANARNSEVSYLLTTVHASSNSVTLIPIPTPSSGSASSGEDYGTPTDQGCSSLPEVTSSYPGALWERLWRDIVFTQSDSESSPEFGSAATWGRDKSDILAQRWRQWVSQDVVSLWEGISPRIRQFEFLAAFLALRPTLAVKEKHLKLPEFPNLEAADIQLSKQLRSSSALADRTGWNGKILLSSIAQCLKAMSGVSDDIAVPALVRHMQLVFQWKNFHPFMAYTFFTTSLNELLVKIVQMPPDPPGPVTLQGPSSSRPPQVIDLLYEYMWFYQGLLAFVRYFPEVRAKATEAVSCFFLSPENRNKRRTPDLGQFLIAISLASDTRWDEVWRPLIGELFTRNVWWQLLKYPNLTRFYPTLAASDNRRPIIANCARLYHAFGVALVGLRLFGFQFLFLSELSGIIAKSIRSQAKGKTNVRTNQLRSPGFSNAGNASMRASQLTAAALARLPSVSVLPESKADDTFSFTADSVNGVDLSDSDSEDDSQENDENFESGAMGDDLEMDYEYGVADKDEHDGGGGYLEHALRTPGQRRGKRGKQRLSMQMLLRKHDKLCEPTPEMLKKLISIHRKVIGIQDYGLFFETLRAPVMSPNDVIGFMCAAVANSLRSGYHATSKHESQVAQKFQELLEQSVARLSIETHPSGARSQLESGNAETKERRAGPSKPGSAKGFTATISKWLPASANDPFPMTQRRFSCFGFKWFFQQQSGIVAALPHLPPPLIKVRTKNMIVDETSVAYPYGANPPPSHPVVQVSASPMLRGLRDPTQSTSNLSTAHPEYIPEYVRQRTSTPSPTLKPTLPGTGSGNSSSSGVVVGDHYPSPRTQATAEPPLSALPPLAISESQLVTLPSGHRTRITPHSQAELEAEVWWASYDPPGHPGFVKIVYEQSTVRRSYAAVLAEKAPAARYVRLQPSHLPGSLAAATSAVYRSTASTLHDDRTEAAQDGNLGLVSSPPSPQISGLDRQSRLPSPSSAAVSTPGIAIPSQFASKGRRNSATLELMGGWRPPLALPVKPQRPPSPAPSVQNMYPHATAATTVTGGRWKGPWIRILSRPVLEKYDAYLKKAYPGVKTGFEFLAYERPPIHQPKGVSSIYRLPMCPHDPSGTSVSSNLNSVTGQLIVPPNTPSSFFAQIWSGGPDVIIPLVEPYAASPTGLTSDQLNSPDIPLEQKYRSLNASLLAYIDSPVVRQLCPICMFNSWRVPAHFPLDVWHPLEWSAFEFVVRYAAQHSLKELRDKHFIECSDSRAVEAVTAQMRAQLISQDAEQDRVATQPQSSSRTSGHNRQNDRQNVQRAQQQQPQQHLQQQSQHHEPERRQTQRPQHHQHQHHQQPDHRSNHEHNRSGRSRGGGARDPGSSSKSK